ncbi:hypothetical protein BX666DRAFT_1388636 [Dichotomocladium elegans]|nr:hypothetical protein BX666DRAFT_1388636 [Dichotomocladium elegans]
MFPDPVGTENYKRIPHAFDQLVTASNIRVKLPEDFSPVERMVLQTAGNLQRLLSAFFNVESRVQVLSNEEFFQYPYSPPSPPDADDVMHVTQKKQAKFKRRIRTFFGERYGYQADSVVEVSDPRALELLTRAHFGLAQLFSHLQQTPQFRLHAVGRHGHVAGCSFWRDYTLHVPGVIDCYIRESFPHGLLLMDQTQDDLTPSNPNHGTIWYAPTPLTREPHI